jgi:hypothetical protein
MNVRAVICIAMTLTASGTNASEGMIYAAAYFCGAEAVNKTMVQLCSAKYPYLAERAEKALGTWRLRYGEKAAAAERRCDAEFETLGTPEQRKAAQPKLAEFRRKWAMEIEKSVEASETYCSDALAQLETGKFEEDLWKEK